MKPIKAIVIISLLAAFIVGLLFLPVRQSFMQITQSLSEVDRAILDAETDGFGRVHYDKKTGKIIGGTIVARHAGEMIGEWTLAMVAEQSVGVLSSTIHSYPTQAEVLRKIGDAYMRTKLTPTVKKIFEKWLAWRR
jgi:pyruvate/2-oxoglutarate dehydrogenase complex dihydrolipoamide dehydrogenase (E3) component